MNNHLILCLDVCMEYYILTSRYLPSVLFENRNIFSLYACYTRKTKHWLVNCKYIFSYKTSSFNFKTIYSKTLDFHLSDMFSRKSLITSCLKRHIIKGTSQIPLDLFNIFDSILLPFLSLHSH